ncbi:1153_t:CDS:2, partial [Racocetra fulgida]
TVDKDIIKERLGADPPCIYAENCKLEHDEGKAHEYHEDYEDMSGCQTEGFSNCDTETGLTPPQVMIREDIPLFKEEWIEDLTHYSNTTSILPSSEFSISLN